LIHRPWGLRYGPEWEASLAAADQHDGYFEENLAVAEDALRTNPRGYYARGFLDDNDDVRVFTTKDRAAGYRVVIFFEIDQPAMQLELHWIDVEPL
jgi:hypothetical protein